MTISKKTMKEVLESDKQIIERLTKENAELLEKQNTMEEYMVSLGINDKFDGLLDFLKILYENKDEFMDFLNIKKNNLEKKTKSLDISNNSYNVEDDDISKYKPEQDVKHNEEKLKVQESIPTPSSSSDIKENIKNIDGNSIIPLSDNLEEIVYYRNIISDKFKYSYFKINEKRYLQCCDIDYKEKEISHNSSITCIKCYRTYNLSENKNNENSLYEIFENILPEHIIEAEKEILLKIKCNNCENISKKGIDLCFSCKYVESSKPIVTKLPKDNIGIKTVETFASETFNEIIFNSNIYKTAKKEGIDVYTMRPLVNFIKENKLLKEKQPNIIIRKISRCRFILKIYNDDKYKNIQHIIKRIYINLNSISRLDDYQFNSFKDILIKILDFELEKYEINNDLNGSLFNKDIKNEEVLIFSCKNGSCSDYVDIDGKYCEDCKKDLKNCKNCKDDFWTDEDKKYCEDCIDSSTDDENSDE